MKAGETLGNGTRWERTTPRGEVGGPTTGVTHGRVGCQAWDSCRRTTTTGSGEEAEAEAEGRGASQHGNARRRLPGEREEITGNTEQGGRGGTRMQKKGGGGTDGTNTGMDDQPLPGGEATG
jgi:hypothetical protein